MGKRKTTEQFKEEVFSHTNGEYLVIGEYQKNNIPVTMKHMLCKKTWEVLPSNFLSHHSRCPVCNPTHKAKTHQAFQKQLTALFGEEYQILDRYQNNHTPILVKHCCGEQWRVRPLDLLHGHGCPYCAGNYRKTTEDYKKELNEICGDEFTVLGEYMGSKVPIWMRHEVCQYTWKTPPNIFLQTLQCPDCVRLIRKIRAS